MVTKYVCSKCGKTIDDNAPAALAQFWLIARKRDTWRGEMVIRCPEHITSYAIRNADWRDVTDANRHQVEYNRSK